MFQIDDKLVSLDLAEVYFCCDLEGCRGACCIEGDSGAPLTEAEADALRDSLPALEPYLLDESRRRIKESDVAYIDEEGDLVTQLVNNRNCVFASRGDETPTDTCLCCIERAHGCGKAPFRKPASCALYPLRLTQYQTFTAVNYHRWDICRTAEQNGRRRGIRLYQFMERALTEHFGSEWYAALADCCQEWLRQKEEGKGV